MVQMYSNYFCTLNKLYLSSLAVDGHYVLRYVLFLIEKLHPEPILAKWLIKMDGGISLAG